MATIVGIRFKNASKLYYFDPANHWPNIGDWAVVETARGQELGEVVVGVREIGDEAVTAPLKPVIRVASPEDLQHQKDNEKQEGLAYEICQKKILEHKLDMKLVRVEYTFDNSKALFYFTANGRVDFRNLVKELAAIFKTRIELRQIGVRDEAKMIGGLGPCGRPICCGSFLSNFQPVTIKMAKEQNLSLNPIKISGVCGRLMCCLQYEQEGYEQARKKMPKIGKEVLVEEGKGIVWNIDVLRETVRVKITQGDTSEIKEYPLDQVKKLTGENFESSDQWNRSQEGEEENSPVFDVSTHSPKPKESETSPNEKSEGVQRSQPSSEGKKPVSVNPKAESLAKGFKGKRPIRSKEDKGNTKEDPRADRKPNKNDKQGGNAPKGSQKTLDVSASTKEQPAKKAATKATAVSPWQLAVEEALQKAKAQNENNN